MENKSEIILAYLKSNPGATKVQISQATAIKGLELFNLLRMLTRERIIQEDSSGNEPVYTVFSEMPEPKEETPEEVELKKRIKAGRDVSQYTFNGRSYGKGPLVRAVVAQYVLDHPEITYKELKEVFPDDLLKRFGIFQDQKTAKEIAPKGNRYFTKPEQVIKLKDREVVVCSQFTLENLQPFLKVARALGYEIVES
ncbi:hypothetical protein [Taibaiella soli]|uniref:Uncharacterized protein n=1 Tax=Taibaiella soli TaxID=1649169 RepID=A0A2W2AK29_9BACT|nr:hypothetical protein [Taibaiella soli]PZF72600.1 hypothetical protein DN068_12095 [Taibaiella soli]